MSIQTPTTDAAFDAAFEHSYAHLVAYSRSHAGQLGDAEDFVHLAYLKCRKAWRRDRVSQQVGIAFFCRAIRWIIFDVARTRMRRDVRERLYRPRSNSERRSSQLDRLAAADAIQALKGRSRDVCIAILAGKDYVTIRRELGISEGALAVSISRARSELNDYFGKCLE
ncbi:MAG: sigma-70 family RNA polymerase sigma factor [Planctomycetaceae bacterium]|nr:sigma-70 family RNA polymerase sigma factor [Planctomycetales bacterium]MCB9926493.1 sigma-70 family RNA polymerase sigma factor [Planctomycetaceae bacterium]